MPVSPATGGYWVTRGGDVTVGFFTRAPGFAAVQRGTMYHSNYTGANNTRNYSYTVSADQLGAGTEYTIQVTDQYGLGGSAALNTVTYKVGTVNENSAAPTTDIQVPFVTLGGGEGEG